MQRFTAAEGRTNDARTTGESEGTVGGGREPHHCCIVDNEHSATVSIQHAPRKLIDELGAVAAGCDRSDDAIGNVEPRYAVSMVGIGGGQPLLCGNKLAGTAHGIVVTGLQLGCNGDGQCKVPARNIHVHAKYQAAHIGKMTKVQLAQERKGKATTLAGMGLLEV